MAIDNLEVGSSVRTKLNASLAKTDLITITEAKNLDSDFAATGHNHDASYSALGHNHDASYAALGHNHDAAYSALGHNHDASYAALGHTHTTLASLTAFSLRDTSAAFDVTLAAVSSSALTAGRTLTLDLINASRSIKLAGNLDLAGNLSTAGAFPLTLTVSAETNVTLPTSGTLATLGANTFTALQTITQATANAGILASTGYSLTGSNETGMVDLSGTWNTSGTPTALKLNITDSTSNAASLLLDLKVGGLSKFSVRKDGIVTAAFQIKAPYLTVSSTAGTIEWADLYLYRAAAATLQLGGNHATTPTAQTLKAHNVTTGTGASLTLAGGTGSVAKGNVVLDGGNRGVFAADASGGVVEDAECRTLANAMKALLISHGLMAAS